MLMIDELFTDAAASFDTLLTAAEVARVLRPSWVYAETRANRLPHLRLGRYVRYRGSAIDDWLARTEQGGG